MANRDITTLHITNDYSGSKVYTNLFKELDNLNINQIIYNPIQKKLPLGLNSFDLKSNESHIIYSPILNLYSRLNYKAKIKRIVKDIECKDIIRNVSFIHAHTWYSDGGVAYELYKKYSTPYIVTIRNTDFNLFFKYLIHLRPYAIEILSNSTRIIFISSIYQKRFFKLSFMQNNINKIGEKVMCIPNGIDDFWVNNVRSRKVAYNNSIELLYVGSFTSNKNVIRLLKAVERLNYNNVRFNLKIIGSGGKEQSKVLKRIETKAYFSYLGEVRDKNELKKIFSNSDIFTMPSRSETFGLVYVEALSQGIPILNTINEGIDGAYENVGEAVVFNDIEDIAEKILKISNNYSSYNFDPRLIVKNHDWQVVAKKYINIYKNI
jgi:glycosyltransferase involved in cell wall biosynthesis